MAGEKAFVERLQAVARGTAPENRHDLYVHWISVDRIPPDVVKLIEQEFPLGKRVVIEELREPTIIEMAQNFGEAMKGWKAAGWKIVSPEVYAEIRKICDPCGFWDPKARLGLGKCNHRKCGCSIFKRWLLSSRCPLGKWNGSMAVEQQKT